MMFILFCVVAALLGRVTDGNVIVSGDYVTWASARILHSRRGQSPVRRTFTTLDGMRGPGVCGDDGVFEVLRKLISDCGAGNRPFLSLNRVALGARPLSHRWFT